MAKFIEGHELNAGLAKIFEEANKQLILISPYIKLHSRYSSILQSKKENHKIEIILVFGKNEENPTRSMNLDDLNFFKGFQNIQIRYEPRLHAKYYANESSAILTSMNLYSFSQDNNIEAGILVNADDLIGSLAKKLTNNESLDNQAWGYFQRVIEQSKLLYHKVPQYENAMLGLSKKFIESKIEVDILSENFLDKKKAESINKNGLVSDKKLKQTKQENQSPEGYCIKTRVKIPFNIDRPMSPDAYNIWVKEGSKDNHPENYCHFSGEHSNGKTSKKYPVLNKNYDTARKVHSF